MSSDPLTEDAGVSSDPLTEDAGVSSDPLTEDAGVSSDPLGEAVQEVNCRVAEGQVDVIGESQHRLDHLRHHVILLTANTQT